MNASNQLLDVIGNERRFLLCDVKQPKRMNGAGLTADDWTNPTHFMSAPEAIKLAEKYHLTETLSVQFGGPAHDITGIDLDKCMTGSKPLSFDDAILVAERGPRAERIVQYVGTFTTISRSTHGLHLWLIDRTHLIPEKYAETDGIGIYRHSKHFAETFIPYGNPLPVRVINDPAEAREICRELGVIPADEVTIEPPERPRVEPSEKPVVSVIAEFNKVYTIENALSMCGYTLAADKRRWCRPGAAEKDGHFPSVKIKDGKAYTFSANDEMQNGHYNDAFEVWAHYKYGGDKKAAVKAAGTLLGITFEPRKDASLVIGKKELDSRNPEKELPKIRVNNRELRDISADSMVALAWTNKTYIRGGVLVRLNFDEKNHASIETMNENSMCGDLARAANYFTLKEKKDEEGKSQYIETTVPPPMNVVRDILSLGSWQFPPIEGIIESPTMRPDGSIIVAEGYDQTTKLYYHPMPGFVLPEIPDRPTKQQAIEALSELREVFRNFPYEDDASRDNGLAPIFTIIARPMINGAVPIALTSSPQQATGKTLHNSVCGLLATGETPEISPAPSDPDEWRKVITTHLAIGHNVIVFDNVVNVLEDASLAAATTAIVWSDRLMGRNDKQIRVPARAVWMAAGNNIRVGGDLVSRCYLIRMDALTSKPQEREGFAHPDLEKWVTDNRTRLIAAALIIARAWVIAGCPEPTCPKMRHRQWRQVIGGMLEYAGANNFLRNQQKYYETADDDTPIWEAFITKLSETFTGETTAAEIYLRFSVAPELAEFVPDDLRAYLGADDDKRSLGKFTQALGYEFRARNGKRYGDSQVHIKNASKPGEKGKNRWKFIIP